MTKYIVIEGCDGVGKTTLINNLENYLKAKKQVVLVTKEPGTENVPVTMQLRDFVLNNKYKESVTPLARELLIQSIRSIHIENTIKPALGKYDYIIQDRGVMSSIAYGMACGFDYEWLKDINNKTTNSDDSINIYDHTIYLQGDVLKSLSNAIDCKKEFNDGDIIESMGNDYMKKVEANFGFLIDKVNRLDAINVIDKDAKQVFIETIRMLNI